jgi:hypothetical protein
MRDEGEHVLMRFLADVATGLVIGTIIGWCSVSTLSLLADVGRVVAACRARPCLGNRRRRRMRKEGT